MRALGSPCKERSRPGTGRRAPHCALIIYGFSFTTHGHPRTRNMALCEDLLDALDWEAQARRGDEAGGARQMPNDQVAETVFERHTPRTLGSRVQSDHSTQARPTHHLPLTPGRRRRLRTEPRSPQSTPLSSPQYSSADVAS